MPSESVTLPIFHEADITPRICTFKTLFGFSIRENSFHEGANKKTIDIILSYV